MITLPIPQSYWVEPGKFLAGEYPGNYDEVTAERRIVSFLKAGVNSFIDLTQPHELAPYENILKEQAGYMDIKTSYHRVSIRDHGIPSIETMRTILNIIDAEIESGNCVYVHCWGGVGRTGTTVGCYLIRHGMSGEQALKQLAEWWKTTPGRAYYQTSPETEQQIDFVRAWLEIPPSTHKSQQNFCEG
jgi:hypothetical protein